MHTDNASLHWLQQQRRVSHHQACWLNLLAEYQYSGVHISGRTHPADFLTRKRFSDGAGPAPHTGHDEPDSALELFAASGAARSRLRGRWSRCRVARLRAGFLHADFATGIRAAPPSEPVAAAAQCRTSLRLVRRAAPSSALDCGDRLLCRRRRRDDRLCVPAAARCAHRCSTRPTLRRWRALGSRQDARPGRQTTCHRQARCSRCRSPRDAAGLSAWTPSVCPSPFLQVHIDNLTGRVWLVPTIKTATAETAARSFVASDGRYSATWRRRRVRLGPPHALH